MAFGVSARLCIRNAAEPMAPGVSAQSCGHKTACNHTQKCETGGLRAWNREMLS